MTEALSQRRRRLLRDEIGRLAMQLFAEHGFDNVTVDDIAAAAGTSPRTFFRYFMTKDEIVLDYERTLQERLVAALRSRPSDEGPVEALRQAYIQTSHVEPADRARVLQLGRVLDSAPALRAQVNGERIADYPELTRHLADRMGTDPTDVRIRVIVASMGAVAATEFRTWVSGGGRGDPAEHIARALDVIEVGLRHLDNQAISSRAKKR
jgi:AcrR family transcriptional regulator